MNNLKFLEIIKLSFTKCLETSERSNAKLKILHGAIAKDIHCQLNQQENNYLITSLGFGEDKESKINGRYLNKAVDITISNRSTQKTVAGIAIKFVMSNYSQNSNNYFENMLGETANIRAARIPYFQIFIIPDILPYYEKSGNLTHWEEINEHYLNKYLKLSDDNIDNFIHTPNKTLVFIIHIKSNMQKQLTSKQQFKEYYLNNPFSIELSNLTFNFGETIIYNDYEKFSNKIIHSMLSI